MIRARVLQDTNTLLRTRTRVGWCACACAWKLSTQGPGGAPSGAGVRAYRTTKRRRRRNRNARKPDNRERSVSGRAGLTGGEADDPDVEEVEVGDAGPRLARLLLPAPGAPLAAPAPPAAAPLLPRRRQQQRHRRSWRALLAAGHFSTLPRSCVPLDRIGRN